MAMSDINLFMLLLALSLYLVEPRYLRSDFRRRAPLISAAMYAVNGSMQSLNHSAQFIGLSGYPWDVFNTRIVAPVAPILIYTRKGIDAWLLSGTLRRSEGKGYRLAAIDRIFMTVMVLRDIDIKILELLWGLSKSSIYNDSWLVAKVILKIKGGQLQLPLKGTPEYNRRVGAGIFAGYFPKAIGLMDGKFVPIQKCGAQQREYYNGRQKKHAVNFLTLHEGEKGKFGDMKDYLF
eukprot:188135_1